MNFHSILHINISNISFSHPFPSPFLPPTRYAVEAAIYPVSYTHRFFFCFVVCVVENTLSLHNFLYRLCVFRTQNLPQCVYIRSTTTTKANTLCIYKCVSLREDQTLAKRLLRYEYPR